ncbi:hypothetical protein Hanom_Chr03g00182281 [Helianthus anomalus]
MHNLVTNLVVGIEKISTENHQGEIMGTYEQYKYTLVRKDGSTTTITDAILADQVHPLNIVKMKQIIDQQKGNSRYNRRALHSISKEGRKVYHRAALADFDLCINFEYNKKVHIPPPNNTIPAEIISKARTRAIFETPIISVVFKDANDERALYRINEIYRYSNQTLDHIKDCMNQKQAKLKEKGKENEQLRKKIKDIIDEWKEARGWYKELYRTTHKKMNHKKKLKTGDTFKSGLKIN